MFSNDNELKKYFYLISYAGIILAIILNLSSVFTLAINYSFYSWFLYCFYFKYYYKSIRKKFIKKCKK